MKNLIKHKAFIGAFLVTYFLFFVFTVYILEVKRDGFGVGHKEYGFPFTYYYSHCFGGYYLSAGLIGNILTAAVISFFSGLIVSHLWAKFPALLGKFFSPEFRAKWYV